MGYIEECAFEKYFLKLPWRLTKKKKEYKKRVSDMEFKVQMIISG